MTTGQRPPHSAPPASATGGTALQQLGQVATRHWFIIALLAIVCAAWLAPHTVSDQGMLPLGVAKSWLVALIFVITGATLPVRSLLRAAGHWQLHAVIQGLSLGLTPLLVWLAHQPLSTLLGADLATGLVVLAALPTTISSCVVLTQDAQGNVAAAVFNACLGNLAGIVITPLWIAVCLHTNATVDAAPIIRDMGLMVILPLMAGLLLRIRFAQLLDTQRKRASILSNLALLAIIWPGLANGFANESSLPAMDAVVLAGLLAVALHLALLAVGALIARMFNQVFDRADRATLMFCASQKTLALGAPLLALLFAGDPKLAVFSLPLLIYHPAQLLIDATLAPYLRSRQPLEPSAA